MTEGGSASSVVLVHSKEIENHKNECRDVTSLEWNVSHLWVLRGPSYTLGSCLDSQSSIWSDVVKSNSSINSEEAQEKENTCIFHSAGKKTGHDTQGCGAGLADVLA